jgi:DNA (cytosine-5)-methyltransferase 1|tara:strand:+ start:80 stop:1153 length:1074 start_codon:yes stop_codon:yes gene_type:complete
MKRAISLFSGMGGDSLGIQQAGYTLVAYSEKEKICRESHDANFTNCTLLGSDCDSNVSKIKDEEFLQYKDTIDLIFAGFPCQGFSQAGKKLPNDPRNTLFREFLRATKLIKPKYIIGENVKGLLKRKTHTDELYIDIIKKEFELLGYTIHYKVMKANLYNIPQNRHRLIIVGIRNDIEIPYIFPEEQPNDNLNIKDIITFSMKGALKIEPEDLHFDFNTIPSECVLTDMTNEEEPPLQEVHPYLKVLAKKRDYVYKGTPHPHRLDFGKRIPVGGEVIDIRKPINTIICTYARQPRFFIPLKNKKGHFLRCLLPTELKQIQGFPINYIIKGNTAKQIIQIGNAVPPPLITQVIGNLPI